MDKLKELLDGLPPIPAKKKATRGAYELTDWGRSGAADYQCVVNGEAADRSQAVHERYRMTKERLIKTVQAELDAIQVRKSQAWAESRAKEAEAQAVYDKAVKPMVAARDKAQAVIRSKYRIVYHAVRVAAVEQIKAAEKVWAEGGSTPEGIGPFLEQVRAVTRLENKAYERIEAAERNDGHVLEAEHRESIRDAGQAFEEAKLAAWRAEREVHDAFQGQEREAMAPIQARIELAETRRDKARRRIEEERTRRQAPFKGAYEAWVKAVRYGDPRPHRDGMEGSVFRPEMEGAVR